MTRGASKGPASPRLLAGVAPARHAAACGVHRRLPPPSPRRELDHCRERHDPELPCVERRRWLPSDTGSKVNEVNQTNEGRGNLNVRRITAESSSGGEEAEAQGEPQPSTVMPDPIATASGVVGQLQAFTVEVYDQNQRPMTSATVTLTRTTSSGTSTLTAVTGPAGTAKLALPNVAGAAEYVARAGGVDSNEIEITSLVR